MEVAFDIFSQKVTNLLTASDPKRPLRNSSFAGHLNRRQHIIDLSSVKKWQRSESGRQIDDFPEVQQKIPQTKRSGQSANQSRGQGRDLLLVHQLSASLLNLGRIHKNVFRVQRPEKINLKPKPGDQPRSQVA